MKRNKAIMCFFIFSIIVILCTLLYIQSNKNHKEKINDNDLSFIIETEDGNVTIKDGQWLDDEKYRGYTLDLEQSSCNGKTNPEGLTWDNEKQAVIFNGNIGGKCKLYFKGKGVTLMDVCPSSDSLATCVKKLGDNAQKDVGDGDLIKHTKDLESSAGDDGYRYSGNNPNNYICFGPGSESYNKGETNKCELANLYRMIGLIPATLSDGSSTMLIKVVKSEYITSDELGVSYGSDLMEKSSNIYLNRVQNIPGGGFPWDEKGSSNYSVLWNTSSLFEYLNEAYKNKAPVIGESWENKIADVSWKVGGYQNYASLSSKKIYDSVMYNSGVTVDAKIGLMYAHDYGYASDKKNWGLALSSYGNDDNIRFNWLYTGIPEWLISLGSTAQPLFISQDGSLTFVQPCEVGPCPSVSKYTSTVTKSLPIRSVFYLDEDVRIMSSYSTDGSFEHPFRIENPCAARGPDGTCLDVTITEPSIEPVEPGESLETAD